jgi:hypothetical protein
VLDRIATAVLGRCEHEVEGPDRLHPTGVHARELVRLIVQAEQMWEQVRDEVVDDRDPGHPDDVRAEHGVHGPAELEWGHDDVDDWSTGQCTAKRGRRVPCELRGACEVGVDPSGPRPDRIEAERGDRCTCVD